MLAAVLVAVESEVARKLDDTELDLYQLSTRSRIVLPGIECET